MQPILNQIKLSSSSSLSWAWPSALVHFEILVFLTLTPLEETKFIFGGRWPSVEDILWWKKSFSGRRPWLEDDLPWKMTLVEDDLQWKTTFGGRRLSVSLAEQCLVYFAAFLKTFLKIFACDHQSYLSRSCLKQQRGPKLLFYLYLWWPLRPSPLWSHRI